MKIVKSETKVEASIGGGEQIHVGKDEWKPTILLDTNTSLILNLPCNTILENKCFGLASKKFSSKNKKYNLQVWSPKRRRKGSKQLLADMQQEY